MQYKPTGHLLDEAETRALVQRLATRGRCRRRTPAPMMKRTWLERAAAAVRAMFQRREVRHAA